MVLLIDMLMLYQLTSRKSSGTKSWQSVAILSAESGSWNGAQGLSTAGLGRQNSLQ